MASFTPHDLRRTFAAGTLRVLLDAGVDLSTVQKLGQLSPTSLVTKGRNTASLAEWVAG